MGSALLMAVFGAVIFAAATIVPTLPGIGLSVLSYPPPEDPPDQSSGSAPQCDDFLDNDGDGRVDWDGNGNPANADPDCTSASDASEFPDATAPPTQPVTTAPPTTAPPTTQPPATTPPTTQPPATTPPPTTPPPTEVPPTTQPPTTAPPTTEPTPTPSPTQTPDQVLVDTRTTIDFRVRASEFWGVVNASPDQDGENSTDRGATGFSFGTTDLDFNSSAAQEEPSPEEVESCETGRRVLLKKKRPGPDRVVGSDRVNRKDRWSVDVSPNANGVFYAVLPEQVLTADDGTIVTCERARSRGARPSQ